ncbi:MAG: xanthine dehydrogenase family protein molybdopterin-binding subunit [Anaerolineae bacterium]|nr:xanthine dehydrogenase family protein molybdopterin-binding subunit [Anaerolineae bacterium]
MTMNRRTFLKNSTLAGAGLLISFHVPIYDRRAILAGVPDANPAQSPEQFVPNAYLRIDADGTVTVMCPRSEMGQGVQTIAAMLVAEDLETDYAAIRVEQAGIDSAYGDQVTGGSTSTQAMYASIRMASTRALGMLIAAAAQQWGVEPAACHAEKGVVYGSTPDQKLTFGELAPLAAQQTAPKMPKLKPVDQFRVIGTRKALFDSPEIVTGKALYTNDVRLPNMLYAVVERCPVFGGSVASFDAAKARAINGVREVVQIDAGIAVVADTTWAAMQGRDALQITWDEGKAAPITTDSIQQQLIDKVTTQLADDKESPDAVTKLEAIYQQPYVAHATMESMSCVADVRTDSAEVWAPTQDRRNALSMAAAGSGLSGSKIKLHIPLLGCGWGRRLNCDYVKEATQISKQVGAPINLLWTRDDDLRHDYYRPMSYHVLRADLDAEGKPLTWRHYVASEAIGGGSSEVASGASSLPYKIRANVRASSLSLGIPVGYWRAVFNTNTAFVNETFMDELATAAGKDPYEYRLSQMNSKRMEAVLKLAAEKAAWGGPLPAGWGRGIACYASWGASYVAQVAEVSVDDRGVVHVHRVVCAVDCGIPINLDSVEAQMEGGIIAGMGMLFKHEITIEKGRVEQHNFRDYPLIRMDEAPAIEVYVVPSTEFPTGIGEMSNPVTPPAIANAIYAVTGVRIRRLPMRAADLQ